MRSLTVRLSLAFLLVSLTGVALVALVVREATVREFDQLLIERARADFSVDAIGYYRDNGSWSGAREYFRRLAQRDAAPARTPGPADPPRPSGPGPVAPAPLPVFPLADADGVVVFPAAGFGLGDRVVASDLARGIPLELNGDVVGTVLTTGDKPAPSPQEQAYLGRTTRASLIAALGAAAVSLALGVFLARELTRPVRELTAATRALAAGALEQHVPVRSSDELGELASAFNQMSEELARAVQVRRQMTADIAHELRTPLAVIAGYAESMRDGVLEASPKRLDVLYDEVQHLLRLVEDLRTLNLADAGELKLSRVPVAPATLLGRVAATYEHAAAQAGVALEVDADKGLGEVNVDPERIAQVLGNLVSNAIRHSPGGGCVALTASPQADAVAISVCDEGEGISGADVPYVFDRLYRADPSRHETGGGSGLGLAIARSIVEAHGGSISVRSEPGHGATFTLVLPADG